MNHQGNNQLNNQPAMLIDSWVTSKSAVLNSCNLFVNGEPTSICYKVGLPIVSSVARVTTR